MALSLITRMGVALVVFALMARGLGPTSYGLIATVFSYATLAALLTEFGLNFKTLRDIGERPEAGGATLNESLNLKIYLTLAVMAIGAGALLLMPGEAVVKITAALFGGSILISSIGDLALVAFRGTRQYSKEFALTLSTSAGHLFFIGGIATLGAEPLLLSIAFIISRSFYMTISLISALRVFPSNRLQIIPPSRVFQVVRRSSGWALDSGLGYVAGQLDGLLVPLIFGLNAAGIYQSGSRFAQAAMGLFVILASVHIPRLAKLDLKSGAISPREWRMYSEFLAAGVLLAGAFLFGGKLITAIVLGDEFNALNELWPGFAAFVFFRYVAAGLGASLTAIGLPMIRALGQVAAVMTVLAGFAILKPGYSLIVVPWIMAGGAGATTMSYGVARLLVSKLGTRRLVAKGGTGGHFS